jgi:hypothetical protein
VAARYASGFNMGEYDYQPVLTWVCALLQRPTPGAEVYFPNYGWIEFEADAHADACSIRNTDGEHERATPCPKRPSRSRSDADLGLGRDVGGRALFVILCRRAGSNASAPPRELVWRAYSNLAGRARLVWVLARWMGRRLMNT